jgi:hypothetical protein
MEAVINMTPRLSRRITCVNAQVVVRVRAQVMDSAHASAYRRVYAAVVRRC